MNLQTCCGNTEICYNPPGPVQQKKRASTVGDSSRRQRSALVSNKALATQVLSLLLQVIALVMDSFTDIDIFGDLQDAYNNRRVPVYILLDQDFLSLFLDMCNNLGVCPEQESVSTKHGWVWLGLFFWCSSWFWISKIPFSKTSDFLERLKHLISVITGIKGGFLEMFLSSWGSRLGISWFQYSL